MRLEKSNKTKNFCSNKTLEFFSIGLSIRHKISDTRISIFKFLGHYWVNTKYTSTNWNYEFEDIFGSDRSSRDTNLRPSIVSNLSKTVHLHLSRLESSQSTRRAIREHSKSNQRVIREQSKSNQRVIKVIQSEPISTASCCKNPFFLLILLLIVHLAKGKEECVDAAKASSSHWPKMLIFTLYC